MKTAYLVGFIDTETRTMTRVGIYGEAHPTICGKPCVTVNLDTATGDSYGEARNELRVVHAYLFSLMGSK